MSPNQTTDTTPHLSPEELVARLRESQKAELVPQSRGPSFLDRMMIALLVVLLVIAGIIGVFVVALVIYGIANRVLAP